jgi:hypothetical protein
MRAPKPVGASAEMMPTPPAAPPKAQAISPLGMPNKRAPGPEIQTTLFPTESDQSSVGKDDSLGDLAQRIRAMSRQFNRK